VALQKYFSHPSLVIFFSPTPSIKLNLRLQMDSNPPGRINPVPYQQLVLSFAVPFTSLSNKTNTQSTAVSKLCCAFSPTSNQYPINSWCYVLLRFAVPFTSLSIMCKNAGPKPFCLDKGACFDFSLFNFLSQGI
jgi:hypothetical protein